MFSFFSIFWIREIGLQNRIQAKMYAKRPVCLSSASFSSVHISDCYAPFLVLAYGFVISVILLVIEVILKSGRFPNKYCRKTFKIADIDATWARVCGQFMNMHVLCSTLNKYLLLLRLLGAHKVSILNICRENVNQSIRST